MQEMAILSYNRLNLNCRLQRGERKAKWICYFLQNPHHLFTTILLFNDACLHIGSECSRRLYQSCDLPPAIAPISQIILVILFAELAPMFAARRHPESAAHFGVGLLYGLSKLIAPMTWCIGKISDGASYCLGIPPGEVKRHLLSREDLQALLFPSDANKGSDEVKSLADSAITNLFSQRAALTEESMRPLHDLPLLRADVSMTKALRLFIDGKGDFLLVYQRSRQHIIGILELDDLLKGEGYRLAGGCAQLPFFTSSKTPALELVLQLRQNRKKIAIALNANGLAIGFVLLRELQAQLLLGKAPKATPKISRALEKCFSSNLTVDELMRNYDVTLPMLHPHQTLAELLEHQLGHLPERGDLCRINGLEFCVESDGLTGAKSIRVRSLLS